jgi:peptidoglycan/LPS O-acetylase OafA/YrhL
MKLAQLTSLRFFAAAMIVVHHSAGLFGFSTSLTQPFIFGQGVSFFFVLSGFILAYVYPKLSTYADVRYFLHARFARIWPAHLATFLLAYWVLSMEWDFKVALANLALVHAWIPHRLFYFSYNAPSWSISTEFFFYLVFPVLIYRWERNWQIKILLSGGILIALISYSNIAQLPGNGISLLYINPVSRIFEFIFGIFLSFFWRNNKDKTRLNLKNATIMEVAVILLCGFSMRYTLFIEGWAFAAWPGPAFAQWLEGSGSMLSFGLLIYVMAIGRGKISQILAQSHLVLLGEISFSLYLLHQILLRYYETNLAFFPHIPNLLAFALFWSILLLCSYLMWVWVEMPARRFILNRRRNYGDDGKEKSWRDHMLQNRNALSAALLLVCLLLPLYLSMDKMNNLPATINSLLASAIAGKVDKVKALIDAGVSVNEKDERGNTPLIEASWAGRQDVVELLLEEKADVNVFTSSSITALLAAVFQKHDAIALMLLERGANPNAVDAKGSSPLIEAAWQGNISLLSALITKGANVNYARPSDGITALTAAKSANKDQAIKVLTAAKSANKDQAIKVLIANGAKQ